MKPLWDSSIILITEQLLMAIYYSQKPCFSGALKLDSRWSETAGQESTYILEKIVELRYKSKSPLDREEASHT